MAVTTAPTLRWCWPVQGWLRPAAHGSRRLLDEADDVHQAAQWRRWRTVRYRSPPATAATAPRESLPMSGIRCIEPLTEVSSFTSFSWRWSSSRLLASRWRRHPILFAKKLGGDGHLVFGFEGFDFGDLGHDVQHLDDGAHGIGAHGFLDCFYHLAPAHPTLHQSCPLHGGDAEFAHHGIGGRGGHFCGGPRLRKVELSAAAFLKSSLSATPPMRCNTLMMSLPLDWALSSR